MIPCCIIQSLATFQFRTPGTVSQSTQDLAEIWSHVGSGQGRFWPLSRQRWWTEEAFRTWEHDPARIELWPADAQGCCYHGHPYHQPSSGAMTMKRKRRMVPQPNGLAPGEILNRAQLPGREELCWGWISSVPNATSISDDNFLRTCGFSPHSQPRFCDNRYARSPTTSSDQPPVTDPDGDLIIVSDDEGPVCDRKSCKSNPYCLNYLGQEMWEDEGVPSGTRTLARVQIIQGLPRNPT